MTTKTKLPVFLPISLIAAGLLVSGCSSFDEAIGKTKKSPDEFQVVVRPPLTLPPSFSLTPVASEDASKVSTDAVSVSDQVLTKSERVDAGGFDALFGTAAIEPDIRTKIDEETLGIQLERRMPLETLFGGKPNVGPTLSPEAEARRIRNAVKAGDNLTASPTQAIDPVNDTTVKIQ